MATRVFRSKSGVHRMFHKQQPLAYLNQDGVLRIFVPHPTDITAVDRLTAICLLVCGEPLVVQRMYKVIDNPNAPMMFYLRFRGRENHPLSTGSTLTWYPPSYFNR